MTFGYYENINKIDQVLGTDCPPNYPCVAGVYLSNLWYGHQQILVEYLGLDPKLVPLLGKVQHGWQPLTGIDYEQGMRVEIAAGRDPFWVWNRRNIELAKAEGFNWGRAIGAPFLYKYPDSKWPKWSSPIESTLLALPTHSISTLRVEGWELYANWLADFAKVEGFTKVEASLHFMDYIDESLHRIFTDLGIEISTIGGYFQKNYLDKVVDRFNRVTAVVSDRVCSGGFYALLGGKPFAVCGPMLAATKQEDFDHDDLGPAGDQDWIQKNIPALAGGKFCDKMRVAYDELGAEYVEDKRKLFEDLFYPAIRRWKLIPDRALPFDSEKQG